MKTDAKAKPGRRSYNSELRAEQARATRERILDVIIERLLSGDKDLNYTAVARAARVSIPTVYRHFPTREDLFEAIFVRTTRGAEAMAAASPPASPSEFHAQIQAFLARFEDPEGLLSRASRLSTLFEFSRAATVPRRRVWFEHYVDAQLPGLPEPTRTQIVELGIVMLSSAFAEAARGYLDRPASTFAPHVQFALDAFISHARSLYPELYP